MIIRYIRAIAPEWCLSIVILIQFLLLRLKVDGSILVTALLDNPFCDLPRVLLGRVLALQNLIVVFGDTHLNNRCKSTGLAKSLGKNSGVVESAWSRRKASSTVEEGLPENARELPAAAHVAVWVRNDRWGGGGQLELDVAGTAGS